MNGLKQSLSEIDAINQKLSGKDDNADCLLFPPATLISPMAAQAGKRPALPGRTWAPSPGAHSR